MSMGSSGASTPTITTYYVGEHLILCHGPIDKITEIHSDEKIAWTGTNTGGLLVINAPDLYGGMNREGGLQGPVDVCMGYPSQMPNDYLLNKVGNVPAYRGVVALVMRQLYRGFNYYIKPTAVKATRIHVRKNGIAQWQDAYAEVPSDPTYTYISNLPELSVLGHTGAYSNCVFPSPHGLVYGDFVTVSGATDNLYNGTFQVSNVGLTSNTCSYLMHGTPSANAVGPIRISKGTVFVTSGGLINAVHVLRDCLTDNVFGKGFSEGSINEASWAEAAKRCYDERLGFSWLWEEGSLDDFIANVLSHIQGNIYQDHRTGQYFINLVRKLETTTGLLTFNDSNSYNIKDFHRKSIDQLVSSVTVSYIDNITNKKATSPPAMDISLASRQNVPIEKTITYDGVATAEVAQKLALRDVKQLSQPAWSFTIEVNRDGENLHKGDAFIVDRPEYAPPLIMRVVNINLGSLTNGRITIDCIEDVFSAADTVYLTPPASNWVSPVNDPINAPYRLLVEAPYYLIATTKGDAFAQGVPTTESYFVQAAASPTPDSIQATLWVDSGAGYINRSKLDFCFTATLVSNINRTQTAIDVTNVLDIELLTNNHFIQIDNELIGVVSQVGYTFTVIRGVLDTVPENHSAGARCFGWHDYSATDGISYLLTEVINTKVTPATPKGELALASASANTITISGRMHLPYPPGAFAINSLYWPDSVQVGVAMNLSWCSRNRFQQTTGLLTYYTASITSEASVTYSYELRRVDTNALLDSFIGSTSLTYSYTPSYIGNVVLTLWSVNPNGASKYKVTHFFQITTGTIVDEFGTFITTEGSIGIEY